MSYPGVTLISKTHRQGIGFCGQWVMSMDLDVWPRQHVIPMGLCRIIARDWFSSDRPCHSASFHTAECAERPGVEIDGTFVPRKLFGRNSEPPSGSGVSAPLNWTLHF
jgi:hypothetical protein